MRAVAIGLAAGLAGLAVHGDSGAQPAPPASPAAPDFARAKQLYDTAQSEYDKGAYADAVRDFGAAYEITKDPVLFFKLGEANEKNGKCDAALVFYGRYVREAKPGQKYVELTKARVAACGGDWKVVTGEGTGSASGSGSASGTESGSGSASEPGADSGSGSGSDLALTGLGSGSGSAAEKRHGNDLPWLMVGGALAFVTAGAVLAYSATSSEQDIKDLYVGVAGQPPFFDPKTAQRYQELVDEGHRYQYLAWGSFGVATAFAVTATFLFIHDHIEEQRRLLLTPVASPTSAGAALTVRF